MVDFKFNSLKIVSLNVRGLRDIIKRKAIFLFIRKTDTNIIFLQETHSCDTDSTFWKGQWGDQAYFSHASHHSAGVDIFFNRFKKYLIDILENFSSDDGRWIMAVIKSDNSCFIICNVYGYNGATQAKIMFTQVYTKIKDLHAKYKNAFLIIGGDLNDAPNDLIDRIPERTSQNSQFKVTAFLSENLLVTVHDAFLTQL